MAFSEKACLSQDGTHLRGSTSHWVEGGFDGIELRCFGRHAEPLVIDRVESSYFDDRSHFPAGSVELDCGLLMRGIQHEWHRGAALPDRSCCEVH